MNASAGTGAVSVNSGAFFAINLGSGGNFSNANGIIDDGLVRLTGANNYTVSSVISTDMNQTGTLTFTGTGVVTLSGSNSYGGSTNINGNGNPAAPMGVLSLGSANALGSTGTITFGGGTLQYTTANATDYSARISTNTSNQPIRIDTNGRTVTFASSLSSVNGSLTKLGAGTLILSAGASLNGGFNLNGGTLSLNAAAALGSNGTISFNGGTLQFIADQTDYSPRFNASHPIRFIASMSVAAIQAIRASTSPLAIRSTAPAVRWPNWESAR